MPGCQRAGTLRKQGLKANRTHPMWERRRRRRVENVFFSLMCIILRSGGFRVGARGARAPSPYFLIKMRPEGPKIFLETAPPPPPPLSQRLDDRTPSPYLQVWISHCYATKQFPKQLLCGNKSSSPSSMLLPTNAQGSGFL